MQFELTSAISGLIFGKKWIRRDTPIIAAQNPLTIPVLWYLLGSLIAIAGIVVVVQTQGFIVKWRVTAGLNWDSNGRSNTRIYCEMEGNCLIKPGIDSCSNTRIYCKMEGNCLMKLG